MKKIKLLNENLVQKIAAGEAIDRPCSILRELLDNSIDSGATKIEVSLEDGGIKQILVEDNGEGISPDDLKICYKPHTTSKISEEQDLERIQTLGFRGEALASISVCSNLRITSSINDNESYQIEVENGVDKYFIKQAGINGTIVSVSNIFHNFPARKRFLKKDGIEAKMCIKVFEEKVVAHPGIDFKLNLNKELRKAHFTENALDRVQSVFGSVINNNKFGKIEQDYDDVIIKIFIAPPNFSKKDKRNIKVFVNKRAVDEKTLTQSLINGHRRVLSPGNFPICYLFLEVNPKYIDFNIHPQKKEVKFFNLSFLFQQVSNTVDKFFDRERSEILKDYDDVIIKRQLTNDEGLEIKEVELDNTYKSYEVRKDYTTLDTPQDNKVTDLIENKTTLNKPYIFRREEEQEINKEKVIIWDEFINLKEEFNTNNRKEDEPIFIGQASGMFLISEYRDEIYFIDQHALHEKIIYDSIRNSKSAPQRLLTPIGFMVDDTDVEKLVDNEIEEYKALHINITKIKDKTYQLEVIPSFSFKHEYIIIDFIKSRGSRLLSSLEASLYASIACRRAIKKGDIISSEFAKLIIRDFHKMEVKHCPHGRKMYYKINKQDLEKEVSRK